MGYYTSINESSRRINMQKDSQIERFIMDNLYPLLKKFNSPIEIMFDVDDGSYAPDFWIEIDGRRINMIGLVDGDYLDHATYLKIEKVCKDIANRIRNSKNYRRGYINHYETKCESTIFECIEFI